MRCIAIDDEPLALNVISEFCGKLEFVKLEKTFNSAIEAIAYLENNNIDLIFLDIQMPHITGIELVSTLQHSPMIIFTTAYSSYALDGFNLNAIDYLLKPIAFDRFLKAINKAHKLFHLKLPTNISTPEIKSTAEKPNHFLLVKVEYSTVMVDIRTILYIEGLKDYIKIYTGPRPVLTKSTLKNIEEKLPSDAFIRVHKSFIVSVSAIHSIENNRIHIADKLIPVGNQYKNDFQQKLKRIQL